MKKRPSEPIMPLAAHLHREPRSRPRVLYVEDNALNRDVMKWRLQDRYDIVLAADDREACDSLRRHLSELGYILMDIELQGSILDGVQLAALFTGRPIEGPVPEYAQGLPVSRAPLLFITAYSDKYDRASLRSAGGVGIFHKPVDFARLTEAMKLLAGDHDGDHGGNRRERG